MTKVAASKERVNCTMKLLEYIGLYIIQNNLIKVIINTEINT